MTSLSDIIKQLEEPFDVSEIDFLPKGKIEKEGKTLCMALPYADPRVYQDRLNQLAPGEWQTPAPIALTVGDKLVTYVTIILCGISHTDVGEASPGENQATESFAQAFKRAASQFGLGRYLYNLEKEWVPFDLKGKRIDLDKSGKQAIVRKMYQKAGIPVGNSKPAPSAQPQSKPAIDAPLPSELRTRAKELGKDFDAVVKFLFKKSIPDNELTPNDCQFIHVTFEKSAAIRKTAASVGGK